MERPKIVIIMDRVLGNSDATIGMGSVTPELEIVIIGDRMNETQAR